MEHKCSTIYTADMCKGCQYVYVCMYIYMYVNVYQSEQLQSSERIASRCVLSFEAISNCALIETVKV